MNIVSLVGRLTADPELKHTQSGVPMARFTVAVDRPTKSGDEKQADFISVTAWNKQAEFVSKYFSKGNRIALTGSIRTGSYTAQDGSKRYTTDVWADRIEFCESKSGSSGGGNSYNNSYNNSNNQQSYRQAPESAAPSYSNGSAGDFVDMPADDDLPF